MNRPLLSLRNLGPVSVPWLEAVGVRSGDDLARVGPVEAYLRAKAAYPERVTLNLLYALQGALLDLPWNKLACAAPESAAEGGRALASAS